ncbi:MAG TPA: nuclear transport factor 2 family protein [Marmoricola sp.]|jgi:ketosteroid isomerase-like protein|nr:nuclear transport factor 2 family protein [Marmoricola sp.]
MDLQERLRDLADRQEITDLITRYTRAIDTADWDGIDDVFTPDAVLDYRPSGGPRTTRDEAKAFIRNLAGFDRWQHLIGQVAIELRGDEASATAYFTNPMVARAPDGTETLWEVGGYYHHQLRRTAQGWRSVEMVDDLVWTRS